MAQVRLKYNPKPLVLVHAGTPTAATSKWMDRCQDHSRQSTLRTGIKANVHTLSGIHQVGTKAGKAV